MGLHQLPTRKEWCPSSTHQWRVWIKHIQEESQAPYILGTLHESFRDSLQKWSRRCRNQLLWAPNRTHFSTPFLVIRPHHHRPHFRFTPKVCARVLYFEIWDLDELSCFHGSTLLPAVTEALSPWPHAHERVCRLSLTSISRALRPLSIPLQARSNAS